MVPFQEFPVTVWPFAKAVKKAYYHAFDVHLRFSVKRKIFISSFIEKKKPFLSAYSHKAFCGEVYIMYNVNTVITTILST